jgi:hypothetical protein
LPAAFRRFLGVPCFAKPGVDGSLSRVRSRLAREDRVRRVDMWLWAVEGGRVTMAVEPEVELLSLVDVILWRVGPGVHSPKSSLLCPGSSWLLSHLSSSISSAAGAAALWLLQTLGPGLLCRWWRARRRSLKREAGGTVGLEGWMEGLSLLSPLRCVGAETGRGGWGQRRLGRHRLLTGIAGAFGWLISKFLGDERVGWFRMLMFVVGKMLWTLVVLRSDIDMAMLQIEGAGDQPAPGDWRLRGLKRTQRASLSASGLVCAGNC